MFKSWLLLCSVWCHRVVYVLYFVGALCNTIVNLQSLFYKSRTEKGTYRKYCCCSLLMCKHLITSWESFYSSFCKLSLIRLGVGLALIQKHFICDGQIGMNTSARQLSCESTLQEIQGARVLIPVWFIFISPNLLHLMPGTDRFTPAREKSPEMVILTVKII